MKQITSQHWELLQGININTVILQMKMTEKIFETIRRNEALIQSTQDDTNTTITTFEMPIPIKKMYEV